MPLITVAIPSFNHERYVVDAIDSVLNQTFQDFELIIIDDGSTDDSVRSIQERLDRLQSQRVRFVHRSNKGLCSSLNEAVGLARGIYFSYLGSDDLWEPQKLEAQIRMFQTLSDNYAACYTDCYVIDGEGKRLKRLGEIYPYRSGDIYDDLVWMRFHPTSPTNLFRIDAIRSVGGFDENHSVEDRDLWLRLSRKFMIGYVNKPLASWRVHGSNSSKSFEKMYQYAIDVLDKLCIEDPNVATSRKSLLARIDGLQAAALFEALELRKARAFALRSISRCPLERTAWRPLLLSFLGKDILSTLRRARRGY